MPLMVNQEAPDFKMEAVAGDGGEFLTVQLSDYRKKWLVLFFYPLDFTFVCPTEIVGISDHMNQFRNLGAEVLGVSVDSKYSHRAWIKTPREEGGIGKINYPLASDMTKEISRRYHVLVEEDGIALRGLFIINPDGVVKYAVIHDLDVGRSVAETLRVLQALKSGGLCPIDWAPGEPNL